MIVKDLVLKDFRGAADVAFNGDLSFDPRMNVFYGDNGAGKSTILDALAIVISWVPARIRTQGGSGQSAKETDIRNKAFSTSLDTVVDHGGVKYAWNYRKVQKGMALMLEKSDFSGASEVSKIFVADAHAGRGLPVLVAYPVTRAVLEIPLRIKNKHQFEAFNAYDEAFSGAANFRVFFEWFRNREDIENQSARDYGGVIQRDCQLEAVRRAIEAFLPDISDLRIMREPSLHMQAKKHGQALYVDQLSDGEKCLLAMVGDLARRLAIANGGNANDPLQGSGVVLIDEVDLHLHPGWQRDIVPRLMATFKNCQFFLSTHSPLVLNNVYPKNLYLIRDENGRMTVSRPHSSFGKSVEMVLEEVMKLNTTLPGSVATPLKEIFSSIANDELDAARAKIEALRAQGYDDPEISRAEVLIRRREVLGK